ncbi:MAG: hypothetical protein Phyf2KO_22810 [Phycisphaerales bacterium]
MNENTKGLNVNVLWITAVALAALVVLQMGKSGGNNTLPFEQQALGEMVDSVGDYKVMTTDGGNEEILFVLDNRNEQLLLYKIDQQRALTLLAREELDSVFASARSKLGGR